MASKHKFWIMSIENCSKAQALDYDYWIWLRSKNSGLWLLNMASKHKFWIMSIENCSKAQALDYDNWMWLQSKNSGLWLLNYFGQRIRFMFIKFGLDTMAKVFWLCLGHISCNWINSDTCSINLARTHKVRFITIELAWPHVLWVLVIELTLTHTPAHIQWIWLGYT